MTALLMNENGTIVEKREITTNPPRYLNGVERGMKVRYMHLREAQRFVAEGTALYVVHEMGV